MFYFSKKKNWWSTSMYCKLRDHGRTIATVAAAWVKGGGRYCPESESGWRLSSAVARLSQAAFFSLETISKHRSLITAVAMLYRYRCSREYSQECVQHTAYLSKACSCWPSQQADPIRDQRPLLLTAVMIGTGWADFALCGRYYNTVGKKNF
jgi:hypothetical protein